MKGRGMENKRGRDGKSMVELAVKPEVAAHRGGSEEIRGVGA